MNPIGNPIAGVLVTQATSDLADSARPDAPVRPERARGLFRRTRAVESARWRRAG